MVETELGVHSSAHGVIELAAELPGEAEADASADGASPRRRPSFRGWQNLARQ
jgi:hypothetical protein